MQNPTPLTVLIIEDNPRDFILLEKELLFTRIPIQSVRHLNKLADLSLTLLQRKPDVIFLDLFLPDSDGNETLEKVISLAPDVAIVIMSGRNDMNSALNALAVGAQDFLIKGEYDYKLLAKTILYSIERKKNQEMLRTSNERLQVVSDATNDMVWEWNLQTGQVYINEIGFQKVYGYKQVGDPPPFEEWINSVHPGDADRLREGLSMLLNSSSVKSYQEEFRYILPNGEMIYIHDRGSVVRDPNGKVIRIIGASQNITDRKIAELKLMASEHRFKSLVQNGYDLIGIITQDGNYCYVSPTVKHILGLEVEYLIGKNAFEFIHPDDRESTFKNLQSIADQSFVELPPFRFQHATGEWRWIKTKLTNMLNDPAVQGIVTTSWDITEARKLEEEMQRLSLVAKETELNRQKQIAAASIKMQEKEREIIGRELHDNVNQILASAKLYIEFSSSGEELQREILEQGKDYVLMAMNEIRKLSKSLVPPSIGDLDLETAIQDLVESFTIIENLQLQVNISIQENSLNGVQKLNIYRVIQEQLSNIIKHANANHVSISMLQNGPTVCLSISDNGVGFDQKEKKRGIGLKNIKARVRALDGKITINSAPGLGCTLEISFPLLTSQAGLIVETK